MAWYTFNGIRSHDCIMSIVLSSRGGGKTYGAKKIGIGDWIKKGEQFIYLRRLDTELDTRYLFFDDIIANEEFPDWDFKVEGFTGYAREKMYSEEKNAWKPICYFIPLSVATKFKSTPYPRVTKIFFDEMVIDDSGQQKYLKNEPIILLEFMSTVIRKRNGVRFFGMANNVSLVNPHFVFWGIKVNPTKTFTKSKNGMIVVEMWKDEQFENEMLETEFGQLIAGTDYGNYAIKNESLNDSLHFVCQRPKKPGKFYCSFVIQGKEIGVWQYEDRFFIDNKVDKTNNKLRFTLTDKDHNPEFKNILEIKQTERIKRLKRMRAENMIYYSDIEKQSLFKDCLLYI